jgi:uncharacterized membrane protein
MGDVAILMAALGVVVVVGARLLIFGLIPPNRWYGVRTSKTLCDQEKWYRANRYAGINYLLLGLLLLGIGAVVWEFFRFDDEEEWAVAFGVVALFVVAFLAVRISVVIYVWRL